MSIRCEIDKIFEIKKLQVGIYAPVRLAIIKFDYFPWDWTSHLLLFHYDILFVDQYDISPKFATKRMTSTSERFHFEFRNFIHTYIHTYKYILLTSAEPSSLIKCQNIELLTIHQSQNI